MTGPSPKEVLDRLRVALPLAESIPDCPNAVVDAMRAAQRLLQASVTDLSQGKHAGSICWTFEDDQYEPNGREIEVIVYYDWDDYSAGDGVTPSSGGCAQIADIEVIAVRYFDEQGEAIDSDQHHQDDAWKAVERNRELLEERCTDAGHRENVGQTTPLRFPGSIADPPTDPQTPGWRMAPSARERSARTRKSKQG